MIVIVIGLLRTNLSGLYIHQRGLGFTWSRLQGRKHNIRIAKLVSHAKESPIRTRAEVLSLVSSRFNSPDDIYSPAVQIPPNPGLPQASLATSREACARALEEAEAANCRREAGEERERELLSSNAALEQEIEEPCALLPA